MRGRAQALLASDQEFVGGRAWEAEIRIRTNLIEGMRWLANSPNYEYNWASDDLRLPPPWDALSGRVAEAFIPRTGASPRDAIRAIFNPPDEKFFLDCSTAIAIPQYHALAEAMETFQQGSFDKHFGREDVIINGEGMESIRLPRGARIAPPVENIYHEVTVSSLRGLIPGDCVYFMSFSDYDQTHEGPEAAWAGEHAVYIGDDLFLGFGVEPKTHDQMVSQLVLSYNKQALKRTAQKRSASALESSSKSITGTLPGLDKTVRRVRNFAN